MRAINHSLMGAVIGASIASPIAVPIAFVSHFVLDSLPHSGDRSSDDSKKIGSKNFTYILIVDTILCFLLVLILLLAKVENWFLVSVCAFAAASPDLFSIPRYKAALKEQNYHTNSKFLRFHKAIQWGERPWGWFIEVPFALLMVWILVKII